MLFSFNECQEVAVPDGLPLKTTSRQKEWLRKKEKIVKKLTKFMLLLDLPIQQ